MAHPHQSQLIWSGGVSLKQGWPVSLDRYLLVFQPPDRLVALGFDSGLPLWSRTFSPTCRLPQQLTPGCPLPVLEEDVLWSLDPETGKTLGQIRLGAPALAPAAVADNGRVVVLVEGGRVLCFEGIGLRRVWERVHPLETADHAAAPWPPRIDRGRVFLGIRSGEITAQDLTAGDLLWHLRLPPASASQTVDPISFAPVPCWGPGGRSVLVAITRRGRLLGVDAHGGGVLFDQTLLAPAAVQAVIPWREGFVLIGQGVARFDGNGELLELLELGIQERPQGLLRRFLRRKVQPEAQPNSSCAAAVTAEGDLVVAVAHQGVVELNRRDGSRSWAVSWRELGLPYCPTGSTSASPELHLLLRGQLLLVVVGSPGGQDGVATTGDSSSSAVQGQLLAIARLAAS